MNMNMKSQDAFTLLEMLLTIAVAGILYAIASINWHFYVTRTNAELTRSQVQDSIQLAQQMALIKHVGVALCGSNNKHDCRSNIPNYLLIFYDRNKDGHVYSDSQIIAIKHIPRDSFLYWRAYPRYRNYLLFSSQHNLRNDNATFWFCAKHEAFPRWAIVLNKTGRAYTQYPDKTNVLHDSHGNVLECKL